MKFQFLTISFWTSWFKLPSISYFWTFSFFTISLSDFSLPLLFLLPFFLLIFSSHFSLVRISISKASCFIQYLSFSIFWYTSFCSLLSFTLMFFILSIIFFSHLNFFCCRKKPKLNFPYRILHFTYFFYLFFLIFSYLSFDVVIIHDFITCPSELILLFYLIHYLHLLCFCPDCLALFLLQYSNFLTFKSLSSSFLLLHNIWLPSLRQICLWYCLHQYLRYCLHQYEAYRRPSTPDNSTKSDSTYNFLLTVFSAPDPSATAFLVANLSINVT